MPFWAISQGPPEWTQPHMGAILVNTYVLGTTCNHQTTPKLCSSHISSNSVGPKPHLDFANFSPKIRPFSTLKMAKKRQKSDFSKNSTNDFFDNPLRRSQDTTCLKTFSRPYARLSPPTAPNKFLNLTLLSNHAMRWGWLVAKFLGTCRFLGNMMLIFKKFMKNATFFLYKSSAYDEPIKSYLTLKFWKFLWKNTFFLTLDFSEKLVPASRIDCNWLSNLKSTHHELSNAVSDRSLRLLDQKIW